MTEVQDLISKIEPYAILDDGDEYGEYVNCLVSLGVREECMSPSLLKSFVTELKRVLKNYKVNYVIEEIEEKPTPKTYKALRYKGGDY